MLNRSHPVWQIFVEQPGSDSRCGPINNFPIKMTFADDSDVFEAQSVRIGSDGSEA